MAARFVGLGTVMRRGEPLAVRWSDMRMLDGVVQVREAFVDGRFTTAKSRSSRRLIEIGPRTRERLAQHWQETTFREERPRLLPPRRGRSDDKRTPASARRQAAGSEGDTIGRAQRRPSELAAQHRELVAEHDDLELRGLI